MTSSCRRLISGEGWLAVGDSASSYDPLSGRGIFKAMRQATNAAIAVDGFLRGETGLLTDYAALVRAEFEAVCAAAPGALYRGDTLAGPAVLGEAPPVAESRSPLWINARFPTLQQRVSFTRAANYTDLNGDAVSAMGAAYPFPPQIDLSGIVQ